MSEYVMFRKVIVFGNQKGGTGKSTLAMHLVVSLLLKGYKVATLDADAKQGTFSRYIENRIRTKEQNPSILTPHHIPIFDSDKENISDIEKDNLQHFSGVLDQLSNYDYVIIDTPGSDTSLSRIAHSFADVIITPMNESFIDLDLLVRIKDLQSNELKPSVYSELVWEQKKRRAIRDRQSIDWIVLINRMSNIASKNRQELSRVLHALSKRVGFRLANGFKERVIFRELFLSGLTLLDKNVVGAQNSLSHIAARQELNDLLKSLNVSD